MSNYYYYNGNVYSKEELKHYGRLGMKWGQHIYGKEINNPKKNMIYMMPQDNYKRLNKLTSVKKGVERHLDSLNKTYSRLEKLRESQLAPSTKAAEMQNKAYAKLAKADKWYVSSRKANQLQAEANALNTKANAINARANQTKAQMEETQAFIDSYSKLLKDVQPLINNYKKVLGINDEHPTDDLLNAIAGVDPDFDGVSIKPKKKTK